MDESESSDNVFKILSLNCWGLWYVSKHRKQRIQFIAQHIIEQNYDFVFLQEIWCESDYEYIRTTTESKFKFAHLFKTASVLGNSGLVILSKWKPSYIHFEPFVINGTPFRPWHGDWFSGKGVAYVRLQHNGTNFHLFGCHMHAQYASNEQLDAQYSIHRICQAYQLGKFINLIGHSFTGNSNRDLLILAGDLNTDSNELPYRILVSMTNLTDSYGQYVNQGICDLDYDMNHKISAKYYIEDADLITCGHHSNTFTGKDESGKRIDYIMYKLIQQHCDDISDSVKEHFCCLSDRVECHGKDVDAGLSFSDHQPVAIQLKLKTKNKTIIESETKTCEVLPNAQNGSCVDVENSKFTSGVGDGNDSKQRTLNELNEKSDSVAFRVCQVAESSESLACENVGNTLSESVVKVNATENLTITRSRIKRHSNVSLEIVENGRKAVGAIPPELKKTALSIVSKLYPKSDKSNGKEKERPNSSHRENPYLRRAHQLLESYLAANMKSKRQSRIFFAFMMVFLAFCIAFASFYSSVSSMQLILSWFVLLVAGLFSFIIMEIIYRFEQNAITGVFEDIDYMIDYTEYN